MRFVITAGPTREPLDPVRFLSNRSSGKMGYALAQAALAAGHDVNLISGPVALAPVTGATLQQVTTAEEMLRAVEEATVACDVLVMCAAVSDYKPRRYSPTKLRKSREPLTLDLVPTHDILAAIGANPRSFLLVGFAAETNDIAGRAKEKLRAKNCDLIVANDVSDPRVGMESDENEVTIFFRDGELRNIPRASKREIARELIKIFSDAHQKCLTKNS